MAQSMESRTIIGEVIDNNDPDKEGKVQIYIPSLIDENFKNDSPWARAKNTINGGTNKGTIRIPQIGDLVKITFEKEDILQDPYYEDPPMFSSFQVWNSFDSNKSSIGESGIQSNYPDIQLIQLSNNISIGISEGDSPEIFISHPENSFIYIDPDGKIEIQSGTDTLESMTKGETLKDKLDSLFTKLDSLLTQLQAETHGTVFGPTTTPINSGSYSSIQTELITLKGELGDILSVQIKNN